MLDDFHACAAERRAERLHKLFMQAYIRTCEDVGLSANYNPFARR